MFCIESLNLHSSAEEPDQIIYIYIYIYIRMIRIRDSDSRDRRRRRPNGLRVSAV